LVIKVSIAFIFGNPLNTYSLEKVYLCNCILSWILMLQTLFYIILLILKFSAAVSTTNVFVPTIMFFELENLLLFLKRRYATWKSKINRTDKVTILHKSHNIIISMAILNGFGRNHNIFCNNKATRDGAWKPFTFK